MNKIDQLELLKKKSDWNKYISENPDFTPDLRNANLRNADLSDADLSYANLRNADLRNADLSDANLRNADLSDADLSYANLRNADLSYANLSYADLSYANLSYATGNKKEIISISVDLYAITINVPNKIMHIGCQKASLNKWYKYNDKVIRKMDDDALKWWKKWKDWIFQMLEIKGIFTPEGEDQS